MHVFFFISSAHLRSSNCGLRCSTSGLVYVTAAPAGLSRPVATNYTQAACKDVRSKFAMATSGTPALRKFSFNRSSVIFFGFFLRFW